MQRLAFTILTFLLVGTPFDGLAQSHFTDCVQRTGKDATVLIPTSASITVDGSLLAANSELAAYTQAGLCAGVVVWTGEATGLALWGDDTQTAETDGFASGEPVVYRVWDASTGAEYDGSSLLIEATLGDAKSFLTTENAFVEDAIYELTSLSVENSSPTLAAPVPASPADGAIDQPLVIDLEWNPLAGAVFYEVQVAKDDSFASPVLNADSVLASTIEVTLTERSTTYHWRVRAVYESDVTPWSTSRSFTTIPDVPPAPVLLSPADNSRDLSGSVLFTWEESPEATSYGLQLALDSGFSSGLGELHGLSLSEVRIDTLAAGTTYFWRMCASNVAGDGSWSEPFTFSTAPEQSTTLAAPILTAPADGATTKPPRVELGWESVLGALSYQIQIDDDTTFASLILNAENVVDTTLTVKLDDKSLALYWRVRAFQETGSGPWSEVWSFTMQGKPPHAPKLVAPTDAATDVPQTFALHPSYPNPFNPSTNIRFDLPQSANVRVAIYNAAGALVEILQDGLMQSGSHGVRWEADDLPSGTYFCRVQADSEVRIRALVLVK